MDQHTTILKVDITAEGEGGCGGDAHAHIYVTLHTSGTTGTTTNPGLIEVDTDASASGDPCGNLLANLIRAFTFELWTVIPGVAGPVDLIGARAAEIKREVDAMAEDRQAPASPIPLNLLFCCNGNIEVNCCSGDNSACADRPIVNYNWVTGPGYTMDPHLPPPSSDLPLLCSELTQ